jgi:signal transduction histidine kinase
VGHRRGREVKALGDWLDVIVLAAAAAAVSAGIGVAALLILSRRSLQQAALVPPITAVAGTVLGVVVAAKAMFLSKHDLATVLVVCAVAGVVSVGVGALMARRVHQLEEEARRLSEEQARAVEAVRTGRELVSWVSHDLRTPLAGLRAMSEALNDGVVSDPSRYHAQMVVEVDHLARLVDDLFELSRIQAGAVQFTPERVSLPDILGDVVAASQPIADSRNVHLQATIADIGSIEADEGGLRRAVANLVMNAIRHTPSDGTVHIDARSTSNASVVLSVRDGCGGIPQPDLGRVFDVGWRADPARGREPSGGGGMGLAIVKGIVDAHRGQVAVRNVAGGCQFSIRLPVES